MSIVTQVKNEVIFARAALRTLGRLKAIFGDDAHTFADTIESLAETKPDNVAIRYNDQVWTYADYNGLANRYARWAEAQNIGKGDSVALLMENRPEFLAAWLGLLKVGASAALVNTNLTGNSLSHCIEISNAKNLILGSELAESYFTILPLLKEPIKAWATGGPVQETEDLDALLEGMSPSAMPKSVRDGLTIEDNALYIYTSGTTGLPKAAKISHARLQSMMTAFSAAANANENDRMYCTLPLYHSAGGVCAVGCVLTVGGSVILRKKFSAHSFWEDVSKYDATLFQYIGELCRYLLNTEKMPHEQDHNLRMAIGNGLRPEIWPAFQERFKIPRILEFYGATEGNVALLNFDGTVGAIGRVPGWAKNKFNVDIVKFDTETEMPVRGPDGFCIRAEPGEAGEAVGKIDEDPDNPTGRFEGYAKSEETERKILRDVFEKGDAYFRTGDLLRQDKRGYFYFVDRIGDTFRWKGENVATSEVAEALSVIDGIDEANVYGVQVPGTDGRAGMASLVTGPDFDLAALAPRLQRELPDYAVPIFLRLQQEMEITGTFKHRKVELVKEGFDPDTISDPIYMFSPQQSQYIPLDKALYDRVCSGEERL